MGTDERRDDEHEGDGGFAREASGRQAGLLRESWFFLRDNKKWWLTPLVVTLLILGALVILGGTSAAPFIYALF